MNVIKKIFISKQLKMAIIVRSDVKMSKGKVASQCAHAAVLCYARTMEQNRIIGEEWCNVGQPKIILKVLGLTDINKINEEARTLGVTAVVVQDAGRTEIAAGTVTVLGLGPDYEDRIDHLVAHLKLL